jgi:hypothetical protein
VTPVDINGAGSATTNFTRTYDSGTTVQLTAPGTFENAYFQKWQKNGTDFSRSGAVTVTMDNDYTFNAVYSTTRPPAELLVNGSFESGLSGWSPAGNVAAQSATPYIPTDGTTLAGFNGGNTTPNGTIYQTFPTTVGTTYALEFDAGVLSYNTDEQKVRVNVGGTDNLVSDTISIRGIGGGGINWISKGYTFTATKSSTTLTFTDVSASTNGLDHLLDRISVTAHPSSSVWVGGAPGAVRVGMSATIPGTHVLERSPDMKTWSPCDQIEVTQPGAIEMQDTSTPRTKMFYRIASPK